MGAIVDLIVGLIQFLILGVIILGVIALMGYNAMRAMAENIKEAWSNIGVVGRKQASLINQLIDTVKAYQESEKLVMLKVSEDMTNAMNVAQMHQQSGLVMSTVNGLAQKFPELKSNENYRRLLDSIQSCEAQLEKARQEYNGQVKTYNTKRTSIPTVFFAGLLGFKAAAYLEFEGNDQRDVVAMKSFSSDDDGERLNELLGKAGSKLLEVSGKTIELGKDVAAKAVEGGKAIADKTQEKLVEYRAEKEEQARLAAPSDKKNCTQCGLELALDAGFCSGCGTKVAA